MLSYSAFKWMARLLGGVAAMGVFALAAGTANAATITVTTDLDGFNDGDGACSLREAIQAANTNTAFDACLAGDGSDTIVFAPGISVITLTITSPVGINNDNNAYLDLDVVVNQDPSDTTVFTLTIQGGGVKVIRDFNSTPQFEDRIFDILPPTASGAVAGGVRIERLLIETGLVTGTNDETVPSTEVCYLGGAGVRHRSGGLLEIEAGTVSYNFANGNGGGICQDGGRLRLVNYTYIAENDSQFFSGGGLYISGTAEITATVTRNEVDDDGGGIYVAGGSVVTVTNSDVFTNVAANGGGIYNAGALTINGGRVLTNEARANGGGVWNSSQLTMDTEVRANSAVTDGGGIWTSGVLNIVGNTVHSNTAQNGGGVFNNGGSATISSASVQANTASENGGGVWNSGALTVTSAGLRANVAAQLGGGIYNAPNGQTLISNASVGDPGVGNQAQKGGGVYNAISATLTITSAGVHSNTASQEGGGVYNESGGVVSISNSGIGTNAGNSAQNGGGIWNGGVLTLTSATVANNTASQGGGFFNDVSGPGSGLVVTNSAVVSNTANQGGGGYHLTGTLVMTNATLSGNSGGGLHADGGDARLWFVTVASNTAGNGISVTAGVSVQVYAALLAYNTNDNCVGSVSDAGHSMSSDTTCLTFAFTNTNPLLLPLALNGGGTLNHALSLGSPALDKVPTAQCGVTNDQRFFSRPQGNACDIGTFELEAADLEVSKSATPTAVLPGQVVTYVVTVTNNGQFDATNVVITDVLQGNAISLTVVATSGVNSVVTDTAGVTFTVTTLNAASSAVMTYTVVASASGFITNTVTVGAAQYDHITTNNTASTTVTVTAVADLEVSKTATPSPVFAGQVVTYTVVVTNNGPDPASNVMITDVFQGGATFGGVITTSGGAVLSSSTSTAVTFTVSSLGVNSSAVMTYTVVAPASGVITNTVTAKSDVVDLAAGNNVVSTTTPVTPVANLAVSKLATPNPVLVGQVVTYVVTVTNNGQSDATNVVVTDVLQGNAISLTVVATSGVSSAVTTTTGVAFTVTTLSAGGSAVITYTVVASATGFITNTVTAGANEFDNDTTNNTASDSVSVVQAIADLVVIKSATPNPVLAGQVVTYTVTVTNTGPSTATNVVITDVLQGGAIFGGVVITSGGAVLSSSTGTAVTFTVASLGADSSAVMVYTATAPTSGVITNTVTASAAEPDSNTANNTASTTVTVTPVADLEVSKTATPNPVFPGQVVTYTVTVTNNGPSTANNVVITDAFQGGATFGGVITTSGGAVLSSSTSTAVTFTVSSLGVNSSAVMTYTVVAPAGGFITNTVTVGADELDNDTANNTASTTVTVTAVADIRVVKTTPITQVLAGQPAFYSVVVLNLGPLTATNIVITDVFQGGATFGSVVFTSGGAVLSSSTGTAVTFTVPALPSGSLAVAVYSIIASPNGTTITNTAVVAATEFDPQPANNSATVTASVILSANFNIRKAASFPTVLAGTIAPNARLTYTIRVTNTGPSAAANVVVTDVLPAGLTFVSASGTGWSCGNSGQTVTCTVSSLSVGAAPAIQIVASAPVTSGLVLTNVAVVSSDTYPRTPFSSNVVSVKVQFRAFIPFASMRPIPDSYEPDDSDTQAKPIAPGQPQQRSIVPIGDVDWARFTLSSPSAIVLETSGPAGFDTELRLFDADLVQIGYDDDSGPGFYSRIQQTCTNPLSAGTYYVRVNEYGNNDVIPLYYLALTVSPCP